MTLLGSLDFTAKADRENAMAKIYQWRTGLGLAGMALLLLFTFSTAAQAQLANIQYTTTLGRQRRAHHHRVLLYR